MTTRRAKDAAVSGWDADFAIYAAIAAPAIRKSDSRFGYEARDAVALRGRAATQAIREAVGAVDPAVAAATPS